MKKLITTFVATGLLLASNANAVSFEIGFNDANGTNLNAVNVLGDATGAWNFGGASTNTAGSNPSGNLNIGYTSYYKGLFNDNDGNAQINTTNVNRTFNLDNDITGDSYSFTVVLDTWQLNDPRNAGQGILFGINNGAGGLAAVGLKAGGGNFAQAYSQKEGSVLTGSFSGYTTGIGTNNSWNFNGSNDTKDLTLQINGDLSTGDWSSRVALGVNNDGDSTDSLSWNDLSSGSGLTSITGIQMRIISGGAAWGSDTTGGTTGNWVAVDNIALSTVPEPSTYALMIGFAAFFFIAIRKRK